MPQLTIDLDEETLQTKQVTDSARARKFAQRYITPRKSLTFESYRHLPYDITIHGENNSLFLSGTLLERARINDRILIVIDVQKDRHYFRWFAADALIVEHIVHRADARFLQSFPFNLPSIIDSEIYDADSTNGPQTAWHELAVSLLVHMEYKQLFGIPPLLGLADTVRRGEASGILLDGAPLEEGLLSRADEQARRQLQLVLDEAHRLLPDAELEIDLEEQARLVRSGGPIHLRPYSVERR